MFSSGADPEQKRNSGKEDVPIEIKREFLIQVVLLNIALFAFALGVMILYFRNTPEMGGGLVLVGVAAFLMTYRRYRRYAPGGWRN